MSAKTLFGIAAAVLVAAALAVVGVKSMKKKEDHGAMLALVSATSQRLEDARVLLLRESAGDRAEIATRLDGHAGEVEKQVDLLHRQGAVRESAFYNVVDEYLITVREVLRKQAASERLRPAAERSKQALIQHLRVPGRRKEAWIDQAVRLKKEAEAAAFDYRLATSAFADLAQSLDPVEKKLAPLAGAALKLDRQRAARALERSDELGRQAVAELNEIKKFPVTH